ncbi:MAG: dephospho-CoA kinase [Ruminococcaceae bacterium]|nr:dephospho-CoA kinase [Oscillospiraceae bacterium]
MIIGITGGTGCGKTTLLNVLKEHDFQVLDLDAVYHALLRDDRALTGAIEAAFPGTVTDGILDRKKLGAIVFADKAAMKRLTAITGPAIWAETQRRLKAHQGHTAIDAIGLIEGGYDKLCDLTVAVTAPEDARIARLMTRDGITQDYARLRIAAQKPKEFYMEHCTYTLENDSTQADFHMKCLAFLRTLGIMEAE